MSRKFVRHVTLDDNQSQPSPSKQESDHDEAIEDDEEDERQMTQERLNGYFDTFTQPSLADDNYDDLKDEGDDYQKSQGSNIIQELSQGSEATIIDPLSNTSDNIFDNGGSDDIGDDNGGVNVVDDEMRRKKQVTLTQNFFKRKPSPQENAKVFSTSGNKKQKLLAQQTLTQMDRKGQLPKQSSATIISDKCTEEEVIYTTREKIGKIAKGIERKFKKGEMYAINHCDYKGFVIMIESFKNFTAMGKIYQPLNKSFIGGIKCEEKFQKHVTDASLDENQLIEYDDNDEGFHVRRLGDKKDNCNLLSNTIKYCKKKGGKYGHGAIIAYTNCNTYGQFDLSSQDCQFIDEIEDEHFSKNTQKSEIDTRISKLENQVHNRNLSTDIRGFAAFKSNHPDKNNKNSLDVNNHKPIQALRQPDAGRDNTVLQEGVSEIKNGTTNGSTQTSAFLPEIKRDYKVTALDLFAGIGGMSLGLIQAGIDVAWAVENDQSAASTYKINHPKTFIFRECIRQWFEKVKEKTNNGKDRFNNRSWYARVLAIVHLHMSPPCQAFARINTSGGKNDEKNANLTLFCIEVVKFFYEHSNMETLSMENVPDIFNSKKGSDNYLKTFVTALVGMGMDVRVIVVDSSLYGDPQQRSRMFVLASKMDLVGMYFPKETHGHGDVVPCSKVLDDLAKVKPELGNGLVELEKENGEVYSVEHHCIDGTSIKSDSDKFQLDPNEPANTIIGKNNVKHYNLMLDRTLTVREILRLQSFPDTFECCGSMTMMIKGIGNAVPVLLAKAIGLSILQMHKDGGKM